MLSFRSVASAAISTASTPSAISSPAPAPTMPTPRTRSVSGSMTSFVRPSGRSIATRAAERGPGELRDLDLAALLLRLGLGQAAPGDFGIGEDDGRNRLRLERDLVARAIASTATRASCDALCASIGSPTTSPIAKMFGSAVRSAASTLMKPRSPTFTLGLVEAGHRRVRLAADRHEHAIERLRLVGVRPGPSPSIGP